MFHMLFYVPNSITLRSFIESRFFSGKRLLFALVDWSTVFGLVKGIIVHNAQKFIMFDKFDTSTYKPLLNAYSVRRPNNPICDVISISDLLFPHTLSIFSFEKDESCVVVLNFAKCY